MHIKKLEICGFKSFADRTLIHFDHDMIGIVGPNGCGKSNVVDAIRWVMGEQSARALRGRAMVDVVFNGSESRSPHGFAEVTLTFDNSDPVGARQLPLEYRDYAEIAVTRRMYRDATSEYLINKVPVRLRDVTEVFLGTGVGRKAYSIVEQGKIGLIVTARPEDRRILIEEAAGITKYKARRKQAEQKIAATRHNLTRVTDLVGELERQLGSLKRQAAKADRYIRYRKESDDLMLWDASHKLLEIIVLTEVSSTQRTAADDSVRDRQLAADAQEIDVELLRNRAHEAERQAEQTQEEAFSSDNTAREHEASIERAADRYRQLAERLEAARKEQADLDGKCQALLAEQQLLAGESEAIEEDQAREEERLQIEGDRLEEAQRGADEANERLTALRSAESQTTATMAAAQATITGFEQRSEEAAIRAERLEGELAVVTQEGTDLAERRLELAERAAELKAVRDERLEVRNVVERNLPALRQALVEHDRVVEQRRGLLHDELGRLHALEELAARMEGLGSGVRNLLATRDSVLKGLAADRVEVPEPMMSAFTALVGERLQCVLVDDQHRAIELLGELRSNQHGRATVIRSSPRHVAGNSVPYAGEPGVLGPLFDFVRCELADEPVVRALVHDAVVVETTEDALRLQAHGAPTELVTLDGTVFHADGRISGGTADSVARGMLDRKREIDRLHVTVGERREELDQALARHDEMREQMRTLRTEQEQSSEQLHAAEIALVNAAQDLRRLEERLSTLNRRRAAIEKDLDEIRVALTTAGEKHAQSLEVLRNGEERLEGIQTALREAEQLAAECRGRLGEQQQAYTERKVLHAQIRERASSARAALERVARSQLELASRIESLEAQRHGDAIEAGQLAASLIRARERLINARLHARGARTAFEQARGELDDARHVLGIREAELRELRVALQQSTAMLQKHEMELQRLTLAREHLEDNVRERFRGLEIARVVGDYHARPPIQEHQRARIRELHDLIDRMGPVNLDAMTECEEVAQRHQHYTEQLDDLNHALEDLEKAIAQMNRESRKLFREAFDGISREFQTVFPKLFRGGKAELRLTNPDDLLETGIEILAQPPGKRLGSIELMSGGEKAFTAVALLFSIFNYKPSPFCILDEVDAPLDEANIDRYVQAVRSMTGRSQFVVITHSRRTMQAVDVLYGVTMEEPGVSKIVGVRVSSEAKAHGLRSERHASDGFPTASLGASA